ncbi:MAG: DUF6498-containing protein [Opitutaceae bacterium]|nr:DUF6498-containing protein [Opitutaceae bacterium]
MNGNERSAAAKGWAGAWPDALAFAGGLGLAWWGRWQTRDLVWSLWLSSLLVGYATIVWTIFRPVAAKMQDARGHGQPLLAQAGQGGLLLAGGLLLLAFFTIHFGMFHFVHSVFLNLFFPLSQGQRGPPDTAGYFQVLCDYWPFVFVTGLAERGVFRARPRPEAPGPANQAGGRKPHLVNGDAMAAPYKNVVRLHLLIFFFAFASFAKLANFWVYTVIYAVYFFPWWLVKKRPVEPPVPVG